MTGSDVADVMTALREGRLSLDDAAEAFRRRSWPITRRPVPATPADMAEQQDPEADVPGSFDDVRAAYDRCEITWEQYRTLARAVADAIDADDGSGIPERPV
jgi:hypothetical protein